MSRGLRNFLQWITFQCTALGTASILKPEWYSGAAYSQAEDLLPIQGYGFVWIVTAILALLGLVARRRAYIILAFFLYCSVQLIFAWSVFSLTWAGSLGAFAGALMWGGYAWFAYINLKRGVHVDEPG